jgi:hypothetical protein
MYSTISNFQPDWQPLPNFDTDRYSSITGPAKAAKFKELLDAGLVSNSFGPKCYLKQLEDSVEVCNSTWKTFEAAQQWLDMCREVPFMSSMRILDEAGNTLFTYPE